MAEVVATQLQYSAREKPSRRLIRRLQVPAVILVACVLAASLLPRTWLHVQLLRHTSACLDFHTPANTVVFDSDPDGRTSLLADARYQKDANSVGLVSRDWRALYERMHGSSFNSGGTAYLGRRLTRQSGLERLVAVDVVQGPFHDSPVQFFWRLYDPGSIRSGPTAVAFGTRDVPGIRRLSPRRVRVFAGMPDAGDNSHFTIDLEFTDREWQGDKGLPQKKRHTFDGWVREGDVLLVPRDLVEFDVELPPTRDEPTFY